MAKANPCAAKSPCAAKNPYGAAKNPCGPCGAAAVIDLTPEEAATAYEYVKAQLKAGYAASDIAFAKIYQGSPRFNKVPYRSTTHGNRFVNNYTATAAYGKFETGGAMPQGTLIAKDSLLSRPTGRWPPAPCS
jgi:hypothetical protein